MTINNTGVFISNKPPTSLAVLQEFFNVSWAGLLAQAGPSFGFNKDGSPICRYRSDAGRKCGIGFHIPDAKYHDGLENKSAEEVVITSLFPEISDPTFLRDLQMAHDNPVHHLLRELEDVRGAGWTDAEFDAEWLTRWMSNMRGFAEVYDLTVPEEIST